MASVRTLSELLVKRGVCGDRARVVARCVLQSAHIHTPSQRKALTRRVLGTLRRGSAGDGGLKRHLNTADTSRIQSIIAKMVDDPHAFCSDETRAFIDRAAAQSLRMRTIC